MIVVEITDNNFEIAMTPDEHYQLSILVETSHRPDVKCVSDLIKFQLEYLAEMAFTQIKGPPQDGG